MLDLIFPPHCLLCSASLENSQAPQLCLSCRQKIKPIASPLCTPSGLLYTVGVYSNGLAKLIQRLKFAKELSITATLAQLMAGIEGLQNRAPLYDRVIAVPLHRRTLARRGFNQALLLAKYIAKELALPCDGHGLTKTRRTPQQTELSRVERQKNLIGTFRTRRSYLGESCLLIDDVYTTGTTAAVCAETLLKAGALKVDVLTAARAI